MILLIKHNRFMLLFILLGTRGRGRFVPDMVASGPFAFGSNANFQPCKIYIIHINILSLLYWILIITISKFSSGHYECF